MVIETTGKLKALKAIHMSYNLGVYRAVVRDQLMKILRIVETGQEYVRDKPSDIEDLAKTLIEVAPKTV